MLIDRDLGRIERELRRPVMVHLLMAANDFSDLEAAMESVVDFARLWF